MNSESESSKDMNDLEDMYTLNRLEYNKNVSYEEPEALEEANSQNLWARYQEISQARQKQEQNIDEEMNDDDHDKLWQDLFGESDNEFASMMNVDEDMLNQL